MNSGATISGLVVLSPDSEENGDNSSLTDRRSDLAYCHPDLSGSCIYDLVPEAPTWTRSTLELIEG